MFLRGLTRKQRAARCPQLPSKYPSRCTFIPLSQTEAPGGDATGPRRAVRVRLALLQACYLFDYLFQTGLDLGGHGNQIRIANDAQYRLGIHRLDDRAALRVVDH